MCGAFGRNLESNFFRKLKTSLKTHALLQNGGRSSVVKTTPTRIYAKYYICSLGYRVSRFLPLGDLPGTTKAYGNPRTDVLHHALSLVPSHSLVHYSNVKECYTYNPVA